MQTRQQSGFNKSEKIIIILICLIYANNLFLDIMKIDAAQYASISLEMLHNHSYLQVLDSQKDYLDKPPLLFWISSTCLGVFGVSNFAYKIGSFLMLVLSLFAIFRFTLLYYKFSVAKNAVMIYATCQAFFHMTNDVRTDGLLTSCVITSIWLLSEYLTKNKIIYLVLGALFTSLAMMAKGPIGFVSILLPIGLNLIFQKKWHQIVNASWLLFLVLVALLLIPMSYGLYNQFDLHPEKLINGKHNQSGIYFFYWLQSFGRITGESVWNNGLPWHFFIGSICWDFFPWILFLYPALFFSIKRIVLSKNREHSEIINLCGFLFIFILLSLSHYKLPHYIFVTLPFASIICANFIASLTLKQLAFWNKIVFFFGCIILALLIIYPLFFFKELNGILILLIILQASLLLTMKHLKAQGITKFIAPLLVLNLFLSFVFYPKLLTFQADSMAGKWFYAHKKNEAIYFLGENAFSFNFYTKNPYHKVINIEDIDTMRNSFWVYCNEDNFNKIRRKYHFPLCKKFQNYPVTKIKLSFLLQANRPQTLDYYYLFKIKK